MMRVLRRQFLQTTAAAAVAGTGLSFPRNESGWTASTEESAESHGSPEPRLLVGCCAYSYRKYLEHGPMTMEDFLRKAVDLRLDGVDMTAYYFKSTDPDYLASLRHLAYRMGISLSGAACGVSMVQADTGQRAEALNEIKKWVDVTDALELLTCGFLPASFRTGPRCNRRWGGWWK